MDIQEDEDLHPPTYNAGRYEQAESMHHIYVQSIKQDPPPPPFSITTKRSKEKKEIDSPRGEMQLFSVVYKLLRQNLGGTLEVWL